MKSVRNLSLLALALAASLPAAATYCASGTAHAGQPEPYWPDRCNEGATPASTSKSAALGVGIAGAASNADADASAKSNSAANATGTGGKASSSANGGSAAAIQGQQQGISGSGNSSARSGNTTGTVNGTNTLTGGSSRASATAAGAGAGSGSGNSTSNTTNLDASDRSSSRDRTTVWANPVIHGQAAAALPSANIAIVPGVCGPRVMVVSRPVVGREAHMMSDASTFDHTTTDRVVALTDGNGLPADPFEVRGGYLIGHQIMVMAAVIGTSTAASFSLGGFSASGGGAQGGVAASGQLQQLVKSVEVVECVYGPVPPTAVYIDRIVEVPAKRVRQ